MQVLNTNDRQIFGILSSETQKRAALFESCLDVGCGMNPVVDWFRKFTPSSNIDYYAIDTHPAVKSTLSKRGIKVMMPDHVPSSFMADLVIAQEVLEHVATNDIPVFLQQLKSWTGQALAITCPNFSGYDVNSKAAQDKELRFVPDHLRNFDPNATDPYMHKTVTSPEFLAKNLTAIFPHPEWSIQIYRAWPWLLSDISVERSYLIYFRYLLLSGETEQ